MALVQVSSYKGFFLASLALSEFIHLPTPPFFEMNMSDIVILSSRLLYMKICVIFGEPFLFLLVIVIVFGFLFESLADHQASLLNVYACGV